MSVEYDHDAIYKAYPNASRIFDAEGVFDGDDNLIEIDQALVDAARVELDKLNYRYQRTNLETGYPNISTQLDQLYHDMKDGKLGVAATTGSWVVGITSVKTAIPKPS